MLIIKQKKHGIPVLDCWYATKPIPEKGIIRYYEAEQPIGRKYHIFETLLSDLTVNQEEIVSHFSKSCKYKINRAPREGVTSKYIEKLDITDQDLNDFIKFYSEFYASKGYKKVDEKHLFDEMRRYRDASALSIHIAYVHEEPVVYHTHILTDRYARLYHSASLYRVVEDIPTTVVGMANRFLHKEDMLIFKNMGIKVYDWGGAGRGDEVAHITEFKESFGGERIEFYHGEEVCGMKAIFYHIVTSCISKI